MYNQRKQSLPKLDSFACCASSRHVRIKSRPLGLPISAACDRYEALEHLSWFLAEWGTVIGPYHPVSKDNTQFQSSPGSCQPPKRQDHRRCCSWIRRVCPVDVYWLLLPRMRALPASWSLSLSAAAHGKGGCRPSSLSQGSRVSQCRDCKMPVDSATAQARRQDGSRGLLRGSWVCSGHPSVPVLWAIERRLCRPIACLNPGRG